MPRHRRTRVGECALADPLEELRGLHMPPMDLSAVVAEVCAAFAIGLFCAWLLAGFIGLISTQRVPPEARTLGRLNTVPDGPSDLALAARAAILQDYASEIDIEDDRDWLSRLDDRLGGVFSDGAGKGLRDALYRPGVSFDVEKFDTSIRAALKQVKR